MTLKKLQNKQLSIKIYRYSLNLNDYYPFFLKIYNSLIKFVIFFVMKKMKKSQIRCEDIYFNKYNVFYQQKLKN